MYQQNPYATHPCERTTRRAQPDGVTMNRELIDEAEQLSDQLIAWRRHLHQHPELSGREEQTAAFVAERLRAFGYQPRERVGGLHGLIADLPLRNGGPTIALRADFDALPIQEQTGVAYASSKPGAMHACGHDAHTAMLLGAARLLQKRKTELRRSVRLIFQPHEELFPGGAPAMIADGALENVERIFGIHICSNLPIGTSGTRIGSFMAAVNPFRITITGKGGHAAMPNECIDPIVASANVVMALQSIVSRGIPITEPAVVSVTQVHGGTADNVIPDAVELAGTIRSFDESLRKEICERVEQIAKTVASTYGAQAACQIDQGYPVLVNDRQVIEHALGSARSIGIVADNVQSLAPQGGGEDFAYYCERIPGAFVFLGASNPEKQCVYPHHHPRFNIDESALPTGVAWHVQFALDAGRDT